MKAARRRIAILLMEVAGLVLPASRRGWVAAMKAESDHVADPDLLSFAAGCLLACLRERWRAMAHVPPMAHTVLVLAILLIAGFTARSSWRMQEAQPLQAALFAGIAASYIVAAAWSLVRGAGGLIQAGMILLLSNVAAAVWLSRRGPAENPAADMSLISAVAFEGATVWLCVLLVCLLCSRDVRTGANLPTDP